MGKTKKETDWLGREKEVHYDDSGNKIGETTFKETLFGNKVQEHFDTSGNKVGETRAKEGLFSSWAEHTDAKGDKIGYSKDGETLFGNKTQTHFTPDGKVAGKTSYEEKFWGSGHNKKHEGEFFKARPSHTGGSTQYSSSAGASYIPGIKAPFILKVIGVLLGIFIFGYFIHNIMTISPKTGLFTQLPDLKVKALGFFESGPTIPLLNQRVYQYRFSKNQSRYIYFDLSMNYSSPKYDIKFPLSIIYYGPEGRVFARYSNNCQIDKNWTGSRHCIGWGFSNPGQWPAGEYKAEITSDETLVARGSFTIEQKPEVRQPVEQAEKSLASIFPVSVFLGFFENKIGAGGPPLFRSRFPQATTRYINYELRIYSPAKEKVTAPYLDVVFYGPDGKVFARQKDSFRIPENAVIAWHEGGRGFEQPGGWPAGDYEVEIKSEGMLVNRGKFTIE